MDKWKELYAETAAVDTVEKFQKYVTKSLEMDAFLTLLLEKAHTAVTFYYANNSRLSYIAVNIYRPEVYI